MRTVVIIHPGALGDVLLAVPAMRRLRQRFPDHRLVLSAGSEVSALLASWRVVDEWVSWHAAGAASLFVESARIAPHWQKWLASCDLAVVWMQDHEEAFAARLQSLGTQKVIVRSPFSDNLKAVHQSDRFLEIIDENPAEPAAELPWCQENAVCFLAEERLGRHGIPDGTTLAFIHPGSGSRAKCVAPEILAPLVEAIQDKGATPLLVEGPADQAQVERLLRMLPTAPPVLKGLDLVTVAGLFSQGALFVGHDSGLTHVAALVGLPTIALFGPTDPARWAPRGAQVRVFHGGPSFEIQASQVLSASLAHVPEGVHR